MKLCYHDAWLYTKVKRLKYKAAFYSPKGKQEKNLNHSFVVVVLPHDTQCQF